MRSGDRLSPRRVRSFPLCWSPVRSFLSDRSVVAACRSKDLTFSDGYPVIQTSPCLANQIIPVRRSFTDNIVCHEGRLVASVTFLQVCQLCHQSMSLPCFYPRTTLLNNSLCIHSICEPITVAPLTPSSLVLEAFMHVTVWPSWRS